MNNMNSNKGRQINKGVFIMELTYAIKDVHTINDILSVYPKNSKNHLLILYGLLTGLRISDIITAKVSDRIGIRSLKEQKTGKRKVIKLDDELVTAITVFAYRNGLDDDDYIFFSDRNPQEHIKRNRAYQIFKDAGEAVSTKENEIQLSGHTLRKTYGYFNYKTYEKTNGQAGASLPELMKLFNHSSPEITLRYIGIEQDNLDNITSKASNMFSGLGVKF